MKRIPNAALIAQIMGMVAAFPVRSEPPPFGQAVARRIPGECACGRRISQNKDQCAKCAGILVPALPGGAK